jgi:hypothetical protein
MEVARNNAPQGFRCTVTWQAADGSVYAIVFAHLGIVRFVSDSHHLFVDAVGMALQNDPTPTIVLIAKFGDCKVWVERSQAA